MNIIKKINYMSNSGIQVKTELQDVWLSLFGAFKLTQIKRDTTMRVFLSKLDL